MFPDWLNADVGMETLATLKIARNETERASAEARLLIAVDREGRDLERVDNVNSCVKSINGLDGKGARRGGFRATDAQRQLASACAQAAFKAKGRT